MQVESTFNIMFCVEPIESYMFCDILDSEVPLETHWTRFIQIAVNKALLNYKTRPKYLQITKLLLENGADIKLTDQFGHQCHDDIDKCSQLIELFMEFGYDGPFTDLLDDVEEDEKK
eukprot:19432_1